MWMGMGVIRRWLLSLVALLVLVSLIRLWPGWWLKCWSGTRNGILYGRLGLRIFMLPGQVWDVTRAWLSYREFHFTALGVSADFVRKFWIRLSSSLQFLFQELSAWIREGFELKLNLLRAREDCLSSQSFEQVYSWEMELAMLRSCIHGPWGFIKPPLVWESVEFHTCIR